MLGVFHSGHSTWYGGGSSDEDGGDDGDVGDDDTTTKTLINISHKREGKCR